jgi:hypothetical protein
VASPKGAECYFRRVGESSGQAAEEEPRQKGDWNKPAGAFPSHGETFQHEKAQRRHRPHQYYENKNGAVDAGQGMDAVIGISQGRGEEVAGKGCDVEGGKTRAFEQWPWFHRVSKSQRLRPLG